jgi:hypothetical protein
VTGFTKSDLKVTRRGKPANNLITGWRNDGGGDYIATITPQEDGNLTFRLSTGVAHAEDGGEPNLATRYLVIVELDDPLTDETPPYVRIEVPSGEQRDIFSVEIVFSEPVTGFTQGDLRIDYLVSSSFAGQRDIPADKPVKIVGWETIDNKTYTARIAPIEARVLNGHVFDEYVVIFQVREGAARDAVGNPNERAGDKLVTVIRPAPPPDFTSPVVTITDYYSAVIFLNLRIEFSEEISSFTQDDVRITGSANAAVAKWEKNHSRRYEVLLQPSRSGTITVTVPANTVRDAAGNGNAAASYTHTIPSSFANAPTVSITVEPSGVQRGPFTVRIEFSEGVHGSSFNPFVDTAAGIVTTADGVLSTSIAGPAIYAYTFTPTSNGFLSFYVGGRSTESIAENIPNLPSQRLRVLIWPEDVDRDGMIDISDLWEVAQNFGESPGMDEHNNPDVNRDGIVDNDDFDLVLDWYGTDTGN